MEDSAEVEALAAVDLEDLAGLAGAEALQCEPALECRRGNEGR